MFVRSTKVKTRQESARRTGRLRIAAALLSETRVRFTGGKTGGEPTQHFVGNAAACTILQGISKVAKGLVQVDLRRGHAYGIRDREEVHFILHTIVFLGAPLPALCARSSIMRASFWAGGQ